MRQSKVFISYSHDSKEHKNRVFELSERLRFEGVDCHIDQYEMSPPEGWPKWMRNQIRWADFVLILCTENYQRRYEGTEDAGRGAGAKWEGGIITQELYEAEGRNTKFIPTVFSPHDTKYIPIELRSATFHILDDEDGYLGLYRQLTGQPGVRKGELGKLRSLPALERKQDFSGAAARRSVAKGSKKAKVKAAPLNLRAGRSAATKKSPRSSRTLVLLMSPEGQPLFVEALRIESDERMIKMSLLPADPRQAAAINGLKRAVRGQSIAVAYRTTALWVRVIDVKQLVEQGREVWNLELQPDENSNSRGYGIMEMNFNNYTAEEIAELRARRILLDEKFPATSGLDRARMNRLDAGLLDGAIEGGYGSRLQVKASPFPALFSALKNNPAGFTAAAKLFAVMQLLLTNTVESIHRLDLRMQGRDKLSVKFEGQRPARFSNQQPQIIKVQGTCNLTGVG
jgi:hypothetical protein